jgi:hypothetical protein
MRIHLSKKERRERERFREQQLMNNINALRVDVELLDDDFDSVDIASLVSYKRDERHAE